MRRFLPHSLGGQIALVMTAALLVASAVNFVFIMGERNRAQFLEVTGPAIARFVDAAEEVSRTQEMTRNRMFGGRMQISPRSPIVERKLPRDENLERRVMRAMKDAFVEVDEVRASVMTLQQTAQFAPGALGGVSPRFQDGGRGPDGRGPDGRGQDGRRGPDPNGPPPNGFQIGGPQPNDAMGPPQGSPAVATPGGPPEALAANAGQGPGQGQGAAQGDQARNRVNAMLREAARRGPGTDIFLSARFADGRWLNAGFFAPGPPEGELLRMSVSTIVLFVFVLGAALWVASRLSRPLKDLTQAASMVGGGETPALAPVRGPGDVRQTLEAFNTMSRRVSQLLGEKDVMLGALGHDLRTPLASIRIRLESMEPESERLKAVRTIEETARLLDDILELARKGKSREPSAPMDISILAEDIVEDYAEVGAAVTLGGRERAPAVCRPILFRRLMRNLIDNALKYGGAAKVFVRRIGAEVEVRVEDEGPGMTPEQMQQAREPFVRGDASRNRGTGGAGLGLALAESIARAHDGRLVLANGASGGLVASVILPIAVTAPPKPPEPSA